MLQCLTLLAWIVIATDTTVGQTGAPQKDLRGEIARGYASWCHHLYGACETKAKVLESSIANLLARPERETLDAARQAWIAARRVYGLTEALRFYGGPIDDPTDGVETLVNAWPLDEGYIDAVEGRPDSGIINDVKRHPNIGEAVLILANERGGEANVSLGWHAIEFLLWGQDRDPRGAGNRPAWHFDPAREKSAARRGDYLTTATRLLVRHLGQLRLAWAPDAANYRRAFEAAPDEALKRMLTGAVVLSGFELNGERLAVAYETRDQEQEHSCFSDTTHLDFEANHAGIEALIMGTHEGKSFGPGLIAVLKRDHPALAADLEKRLAATRVALAAIPAPFDQAFLGDDEAPGRTAMRAAMEALERQTDTIAIVGRSLGFELPLKPAG